MTASGVSCSRLPVVQQAPGRAEALVELAPADDALVGGQLQKVMLPPAGVAAKDVETRDLHRHSPVARYVRNLSTPPSARVTAVSQASVKFLNSLVILFTSAVGDAIFSLRAGRNRQVGDGGEALVTGAPPGSRAACRRRAPSDIARATRLPARRTRRARRAPRSCSCAAAAAASRGSAIRGDRPGSRSGVPAGSPSRRAVCPNCHRGIGCTTGSTDLRGGGTARCPDRKTAAARRC